MSKNFNTVSKLRINSQGQLVTRAAQDSLDALVDNTNRLVTNPFFNGRLIKDITVVAGTEQDIAHGLGRRYSGMFIVDTNGPIDSWELNDSNPRKKSEIQLTISGSATQLSIWVF